MSTGIKILAARHAGWQISGHLQGQSMPLSQKDEGLVRLFMTACYHQWDKLPVIGKSCLETGAVHAEVQGCIRHMCV